MKRRSAAIRQNSSCPAAQSGKPAEKCRTADARPQKRGAQRKFAALVGARGAHELFRERYGRPAEFYAPLFGEAYPFPLARAYVRPFVFRNEGKHLQHDVRHEFADERIGAGSGIEQRHVKNENVRADILKKNSPAKARFNETAENGI